MSDDQFKVFIKFFNQFGDDLQKIEEHLKVLRGNL